MTDAPKLNPSELPFERLCEFFEVLKSRGSGKKQKIITTFFDRYIKKESHEAFDVMRLVLPKQDTERGNYNLLDKRLLEVLIQAANIDKKHRTAGVLRGWKQFTGDAAGKFSHAMEKELFNDHCFYKNDSPKQQREKMKVNDVNEMLDNLVKTAGDKKAQASLIQGCFQKMTPTQMRYLTDIILKDMKIGASETTIFKHWHPDAQEVYNNSGMSLRKVFNEMIDKDKPWRCDLKPGAPIRPQLACATIDAKLAFERMHRPEKDGGALRPFIVETKFDGERMQVHRCKDGKICYFSRNAIDHGERGYSVMNEAILAATGAHQEIILDGELLVWNKVRRVFEPFGGVKSVVNAFKENVSPDTLLNVEGDYGGVAVGDASKVDYSPPKFGDLELLYIPFDILFLDGTPLINKQLHERQKILADVVAEMESPVPGAPNRRVVPLIPDRTVFNGALASRKATTEEEIKAALECAELMREEGIIVKALDSYWKPEDRSFSWLKLKPDYVRALDIDAAVVGAYYASGRRGGRLTQWLMGVRSTAPKGCDEPLAFTTYCKVGTGLSYQEVDQVNEQLQPYLIDSLDNDGRYVDRKPACVKATGQEKPDVWVNDLSKTVVFDIRADVRAIASVIYATNLSLRFPRVDNLSQKSPADASTEAEVYDYIKQKKDKIRRKAEEEGTAEGDGNGDGNGGRKRKGKGRGRGGGASKRPKVGQVAAAFKPANLSHVEQENTALADCKVCFLTKEMELPKPLDVGTKIITKLKKEDAEKFVKKMGGETWMSADAAQVTHRLAGIGSKEAAFVKINAKKDKDVISIGWLMRCAELHQQAPLRPKDYLAASSATRDAIRHAHLTGAIDGEDLAAMLNLMPSDGVDRRDLQERLVKYFQGAAPAAAVALLKNAPGGIPSPRAHVLPFIDSLLAKKGYLDYDLSILHGYTLVFVALGGEEVDSLPPTGVLSMAGDSSTSAAAVSATSRRLKMERIALEARAHGASVVQNVEYEITHVVGIQFAHNGAAHSAPSTSGFTLPSASAAVVVSPAALLTAVRDQAGGTAGVAALEKGLKAGKLQVASQEWLEECYAVADAAPLPALSGERGFPQQVEVPDAADYPLVETGAHGSSYDTWPWREFGPAHVPAPAPKQLPKAAPPVRAPRRRGNATKTKNLTAVAATGAGPSLSTPVTVKDEELVKEEEMIKEEPLSEVAALPALPLAGSEEPPAHVPVLASVPVLPSKVAADGVASGSGDGSGGGRGGLSQLGDGAAAPLQDRPKISLRERAKRLGI